jgi:hypothetical protein
MWTKPIALEQTVAENLYLNPTIEADLFGVEIEVEGSNILISDSEFNKYWRRTEDGSLRKNNPGDDAWEYRFREGLNIKDTERALELIQKRLTRTGVTLYESGRTSVHVHVNFLKEKLSTLYNFITLAVIFDELFVSQNGPHRVGNNFCFRAKDAQGLLVGITRSIVANGNLGAMDRNHRYCSINVASLFKFGTVEFRSMEFTIDNNRLMHWVMTLQAMKEAARKFKNPLEIMTQFSTRGPERFIIDTLGQILSLKYLKVPNHAQMVFDGLRLVQEFANSSSWQPMKTLKKLRGDNYGLTINNQVPVAPPVNPGAGPAPHGVPINNLNQHWFFNQTGILVQGPPE